MSFTNPYFLIGLAGVAAPILLHLLTRDQVKKVAFSTMRFFAKGAKAVVQRKKFQELLLILMRAALVALLAVIFARPFFKSQQTAEGTVNHASVVVVDTSGSMRREGAGDAAKDAAAAALSKADAAALVRFADSPAIVEPFGASPEALKSEAAQIAPGYGGTNIVEALRRGNDLLRGVAARNKELILISDLERQGWTGADWKLDPGIKLTIQPIQPKQTQGSIAITQADAPSTLVLDKQPASIAVRISNFGDQPKENLEVVLTIDGAKIDTQKVNIPPGRSVAARFRHVFDTPGDHLGTVGIGEGEPFYFNARIVPRIPILLINGNPSNDPRQDAAFFLSKALAPGEETPFAIQTTPASQVKPEQIEAVKVVVLADVGEVAKPVADALSALLERGGGVLFFPGEKANADKFNATFGNVAPARLRQPLVARPESGETAESLTKVDYEHPIFSVFAAPHHGDLGLPKFARYWETTDTQRSRVLARFGDGRPAVLERAIGKGTSLALVSAPGGTWNNLPYTSVFLPVIHQMVRHLAVQTGERTNYSVGENIPLPQGAKLIGPDGKETSEPAVPGFHKVLSDSGSTLLQLAVNGSFAEANPAVIAPEEIVAAMETPADETASSSGGAIAGGAGSQDMNLWWFLLCGVVALSAAELYVANRTLRH